MGRPVVYCDKCGKMLREDDFSRNQATTFENRSFCAECRPLESYPILPVPPKPLTPKPFKQVSTTRIPKVPSGAFRMPSPAAESAPPPPQPPPPASKTPLVIGVVVAGLVLAGLGAGMMSGGGKERRSGGGDDNRDVRVVSDPTRAGTREKEPDPGPTSEDPAKAAFAKAADLRRLNPTDVMGQFKAFDDIVQKYGSSPIADLARKEIVAIQRRLTDELGQLSEQARVPLGGEQFQAVVELWQRAKPRYALPDWTRPVEDKIREANDMAASRFATVRDQGLEAKKRNDAAELKKNRDRLQKWGMPGYVEEFDKAIAAAAADKPDPTDKPPDKAVPKEVEVYRAAWKEALLLVPRGNPEAAPAALQKAAESAKTPELKSEAARDAEDLGLALRAAAEGRAMLSKAAKGQKVSLVYLDASGARASVEGIVAASDGQRLEIKKGEESVLLLAGEVGAASLGELFRSRPAKQPTDTRAVTLLCALDGDLEAAKKSAGETPLPEKVAALAADAAEAGKSAGPKEADARRLFGEAEAAYVDPLRLADAARIYKSLLAEFADTGFVRRNKGAIAPRAEGVREIFLPLADLGATNNFKQGKHGAIEAWMSTKDMDAFKDSYVQLDFSAMAETDYKLWVLVGGCCQEVFTFLIQGTDLQAPNPKKLSELIAVPLGGEAAGAVKTPSSALKKRHVDHTGPKEPDRWEWVQVPLQKYATAGPKSVRLLTVNKGFSVASAYVTAGKPGPPKDADWKEWERSRAETPGYAYYRAQSATGGILREFWMGISGGEVELLKNHPNYPDKPTGSKVETSFEAPRDWADDYGTRMRGWVHVPMSGKYVFWIASDDKSELWLSSDDTADKAKLQRIGFVPDFTAPNDWGKHASQQSQPIELVAGRRYYIEAFQKEGGGGDNLSVGWQLPDGRQERPIPGNRLSPWRKR